MRKTLVSMLALFSLAAAHSALAADGEREDPERCSVSGWAGMWTLSDGVSLRVADRHVELRRPATDAAPAFDRLIHEGGQFMTLRRLREEFGRGLEREPSLERRLVELATRACILVVERGEWRAAVTRTGPDELVMIEAGTGAVWRYARGVGADAGKALDLRFFSAPRAAGR